MSRSRAARVVAAAIGVTVLAPAARAAEQWIVPAPALAQVTQPWKEGSVAARSEDGRPFVEIRTDGHGNPALAVSPRIEPAADARRRFLSVTLRVRGVQHLSHLQLRLGSDAFESSWFSVAVPIYADGEYNFLQEDTWAAVTLSLGDAERTGSPDRERIDSLAVMVTDDARGAVSVDFAGAALVDAPKRGVVSFTFDDGYKEHLTALRLLAERGWRGTAYVIPQQIGVQPAYLSPGDLAEIARLGSDVAAHDDPPFTTIPAAELEPRVRGIRQRLSEWGFAEGAQHLAYPLGKQEPRHVRPTIARAFTTARIAGSGPETLPPADPHLLRAVNVLDTTKPAEVGVWARRARDEGEWLILMFHWLPEKTTQHTDYALADFRRVVAEVAKAKVRVASIAEVWRDVAPKVAARNLFPPHASSPAAPAR